MALVASIAISLLVPQAGHPSGLQVWLAGEAKEFNYRVWTSSGLATQRWSTELKKEVPLHYAQREYEKSLADFLIFPTTTITATITTTATPTPAPMVAISRLLSAPFISNDASDNDTPQLPHAFTLAHEWLPTLPYLLIFLALSLVIAKAISDFNNDTAHSPPPSPIRKPSNALAKRRRAKPGAIVVKDRATILAALGIVSTRPSPFLTRSVTPPWTTTTSSPYEILAAAEIATLADEAPYMDIVVPAQDHMVVDKNQLTPSASSFQPFTTIIGGEIDLAPSSMLNE